MLKRYLVEEGMLGADQAVEISGVDGDFKACLSSYGKFYGVFGDELERESVQKIVEEIIRLGTIYGGDKNQFMETVEERYGDVLEKDQLKKSEASNFGIGGDCPENFLK